MAKNPPKKPLKSRSIKGSNRMPCLPCAITHEEYKVSREISGNTVLGLMAVCTEMSGNASLGLMSV